MLVELVRATARDALCRGFDPCRQRPRARSVAVGGKRQHSVIAPTFQPFSLWSLSGTRHQQQLYVFFHRAISVGPCYAIEGAFSWHRELVLTWHWSLRKTAASQQALVWQALIGSDAAASGLKLLFCHDVLAIDSSRGAVHACITLTCHSTLNIWLIQSQSYRIFSNKLRVFS